MSEKTSKAAPAPGSTNLPVGEILRRTRLHYKQDLPDIEKALRIRAEQIEAIESGDLSKLPGRVYALGFVRSYSEFLGLDGDKMVELFKQQSGNRAAVPALNFPIAPDESKLPPLWLVIGCSVFLVVSLGMWGVSNFDFKNSINAVPSAPDYELPHAAAPPQEELQPAMAGPAAYLEEPGTQIPAIEGAEITGNTAVVTDESSAPAVESTALVGKAARPGITLNIKENSWVQIKDQKGETVISRVLKAGDQYYVPDRPDLNISLGNSGGVEFEVDGQKLRPIGKPGEVKRGVTLDAEALKRDYALGVAPAGTQ